MEEQQNSRFNFNRIFEYCLLALIFLVPIAFYPSILVSAYAVKITLVVAIVVIFIGAFLAFVLGGGFIKIPKTKILIPLIAFPIFALVSSLFSGAVSKSITGEIFELGTTGSFMILVLLAFIAMLAVRESKTGVRAILAFMISSGVIVLHLLMRIVAIYLPDMVVSRIPNFLLSGPTDTVIFLGGGVVTALALLNMFSLGKKMYAAIYILLGFAMLFIGATGFMPVIVATGLFALIYFVYVFSWSAGSHISKVNNKAIFPSLMVLIMSVVFILSGTALTGYLASILKVDSIEVRPNLSVTSSLVGTAWKSNPALGVGPNMFKELWDMHKPSEINITQFWASNFNFGSGFIPTIAATTGILGLLSVLSFLVLFFWAGFKSVFAQTEDGSWRFVSVTSFLLSLFFWIMAFFYPPSLPIIALMFVFNGVAIATLVEQGIVASMNINVFSNPKANFASVFVIVVLLISSIAGGYIIVEKVVAASIAQRGYNLLLSGDSEAAKNSISSALRLSSNESYWRIYSQASLSRADLILSSISSPDNISEPQRAAIQTEIAGAVEGVRSAIAWNPKNYENWFVLGSVYEVLARSGIDGAAENASSAFTEAQNRNPLNPAIPLAFSRLAALGNDLDGARQNVYRAIELKSNYTDAYFTLAQIEAAANNIPGAIKSVEATTLIDPNNAALYFQLGLLKYSYEDYKGAIISFERAIQIVPDYANAMYFLGLSYDNTGRREDAVAVFEEIYKTNPESSEVALILSNLKSGKRPFANAEPPMDSAPEERPKLPIDE